MSLDPDLTYEECSHCKGDGVTVDPDNVLPCPWCNGHGLVEHRHDDEDPASLRARWDQVEAMVSEVERGLGERLYEARKELAVAAALIDFAANPDA